MKTYRKSGTHLFCGHWNGSPVEIGVTELLREVPPTERLHYHDYHEYYVVLEGGGSLTVSILYNGLSPEARVATCLLNGLVCTVWITKP